MSKWSTLYEKDSSRFPSTEAFVQYKIKSKQRLVDIVLKYATPNCLILEAGCGSGITTSFLALRGYRTAGIDSDPDMITFARGIAKQLRSPAQFDVDDIRQLGTLHERARIIFSNGVMEHFDDQSIVDIVNRHLDSSDIVIISVPSDHFSDNQRLYGDERFLNQKTWQQILSGTTGKIIEEFDFDAAEPTNKTPQFIGFVLSRT